MELDQTPPPDPDALAATPDPDPDALAVTPALDPDALAATPDLDPGALAATPDLDALAATADLDPNVLAVSPDPDALTATAGINPDTLAATPGLDSSAATGLDPDALAATPDPDALAAALLQLSEHARLLHALDTRHNAATAETAQRITALTALATGMQHTLDDQAAILAGLTGLTRQVADLTARLNHLSPPGDDTEPGYRPGPQHRFWQLDGPDRACAISRLRAWTDQVYRPGYGRLAAQLGPCWDQHPLCLYTLDWLSELWSVLYLQPFRTPDLLAAQAEWQTRLMAAAAAQMAAETTRCPHTRTTRQPYPGHQPGPQAHPGSPPYPGARP